MIVSTQTYYVHHFDLFSGMGGQFFSYLPSGFCELVDEQDIHWFQWLLPHRGRILPESVFSKFQEDCPQPFRESLLSLEVLKSLERRSPLELGIQLFTDVPERVCGLSAALCEGMGAPIHVCSELDALHPDYGLTIVYCDQYREKIFRQLMKNAPKLSRIIQCAYRLDRFFYLDNPYFAEIGNPDHFSCRQNLQRARISKDRPGGIFELFDFISTECPSAKPAISIGKIDYSIINWLIYQQFRKLLGLADEMFCADTLNEALSLDLIQSKIHRTPVSHYESYWPETMPNG